MQYKMLLAFATIILASTNFSYLGYAYLERCKFFGSQRVYDQTQVKVQMSEARIWFAGDTNDNTVA